MKKYIIVLFSVFFSLTLISCSNSNSSNNRPGNTDIPENFVLGGLVEDEKNEENLQLTCIAHNDNDHYYEWSELVYEYNGAFNYFNVNFPLKTGNRLTVYTEKDVYVEISLLNDEKEVVYTSIPNVNGVCYLFPNWYSDSYKISVKYYDDTNDEYIVDEFDIIKTLNLKFIKTPVKKEIIDIMFVVDTTASMDDELMYLKNEISDVIERVSSFNSCDVNVAVLLYKDKGEIYETLYSEFTNNVQTQLDFLKNKIAYGGGDYEEAVDVAIEEAYSKSWSDKRSTKLLVHIGDAPAHDENIDDWYNSVLNLCSKGIRLITVASSGINKKTEYLFRSMTLISNGTYVALTNHSGIGDEHMDSNVDVEVVIEYLDNCLVRLINGYHTGIFYDPIPIK